MYKYSLTILIVAIACLLSTATSYSTGINDLATQINDILSQCQSNQSCFGSSWSISVDQYNSTTLTFDEIYRYNPLSALTPASNTKLLTTIAMYLTMGQHYTIQTPFYTDKPFQAGQPINTLCVHGQGDPSVTSLQLEEAAQFFAKSSTIQNLVFDNTYYVGNTAPPSWEWEDLTSTYGALPTTLMVNENTVTFNVQAATIVGGQPSISLYSQADSAYLNIVNTATTGESSSQNTVSASFTFGSIQPIVSGSIPLGTSATISVPILNPDTYFLNTFAEMIALSSPNSRPSSTSLGKCNDEMYPVYVIESDNLDVLINHTLQVSDNLYAESFLRIMGAFNNQSSTQPSSQNGLYFVQNILNSMKVDPLLYQQVDGCGLSRNNQITSMAFLTLLESMYQNVGDPEHTYFSLLPVGGKSGTLSYRSLSSAVHAKTGSMTGVSSLSGIITPNGIENTANPLFFSIIANNANYATQLDPIIDSIVNLLTQFSDISNQ